MDGITPKEASYNELALLYFGSKSFLRLDAVLYTATLGGALRLLPTDSY